MKSKPCRVATSLLLAFIFALAVPLHAGTVEDIKEGSKQAAKEIKEGAIETGRAAADIGKDIKEGSKKAWEKTKEGAKEVGKDFKKAYKETRDAVRKEFSGNDAPAEKTNKTKKDEK
ncbi:MAG: hypothetical protein P8X96_14155 [Desulfobacteraceae bacterium]|jgi:hypothetical protein